MFDQKNFYIFFCYKIFRYVNEYKQDFYFFVNFVQKKGTYRKVLPCMNQNVPRWYTKTYSLHE